MVKVGSKHKLTMGCLEDYVGYALSSEGWNGWACPGFTVEVAAKMMYSGLLDMKYDASMDAFICYDDGEEPSVYEGKYVDTEDGRDD